MNCAKVKNYHSNLVRRLVCFLLVALTLIGASVVTGDSGLLVSTASAADYTYTYYPKYTGNSGSFVDALKAVGVSDTSLSNRKAIAALNGYTSYSGTAGQNSALLSKLKNGTLIKSKTAVSGGDWQISIPGSVTLEQGKSTTIVVTFMGSGISSFSGGYTNSSVISASFSDSVWKPAGEWCSAKINVTGKSVGTSTLTFQLNGTKTLSKSVTVNVVSSSYATYTGVNYRSLTSDSRRIAVCDKAVQMATVLWTAPCDFPTWKSSGGTYNTVMATDGTSAKKFVAGKTYQGIPYSMAGRTYDDVKWKNLVASGLTTSGMTGAYYSSNKDTTAKGIDCSYLVCTALNTGCGTSINLNTSSMLNSSSFKKINRSQMLPGDIFLKSGHCMLFLGLTSSGKYAVIEANASYSRVVYRELAASDLSAYGCYRYTILA